MISWDGIGTFAEGRAARDEQAGSVTTQISTQKIKRGKRYREVRAQGWDSRHITA